MSVAKSPSSPRGGLPEMLRPLFWDCDFDQLDWQQHRDFIIRRVLVDGPWDAIRWIRSELSDPVLRDWMKRYQGRPLTPPQLRFWELILDLPTGLVDTWLQSAGREIWDERARR
ncbi:MAG: hypothetical protein NTY19_31315 [Planctomycetota bacterium]|nr:hypothetical protein [Planctomycetota bacterium]